MEHVTGTAVLPAESALRPSAGVVLRESAWRCWMAMSGRGASAYGTGDVWAAAGDLA